MAGENQAAVSLKELLVSSLAQTDALAKLLIEQGIISQQEFLAKISEERATYHRRLNPVSAKQLHPSQTL
jgi:hypothetical protein